METVKSYSVANVDLTLRIPNASGKYRNVPITSFPSGESLISLSRRVAPDNITAGDLKLPLIVQGKENEYLQDYCNFFQSIAKSDEVDLYTIDGHLKDNMGKEKATFENGVILAMPPMNRGPTSSVNTWVLRFTKLIIL